MPSRPLNVISTPPLGDAVVDTFVPALRRALDGEGPALIPTDPTGPATAPSTARPESGHSSDNPSRRPRATSPEHAVGPGVAVVLATSGSTGEPKWAALSAGALRASARSTHVRLGGPGRWLLALSPARVAGLQVLVRCLDADCEPVAVPGRFTAEAFVAGTTALHAVPDGPRRRYTSLVPTQLHRLLDAGAEARAALASYDAVLVGGAAIPPSLLRRATEAGVRVVHTYGMTETCGGCVYDGVPLDDVRLRIDADGRVLIGGPVLFDGYLGRPELTAEVLADGWLRTCDFGRLDATGRLEILGRIDDMINSGGVKVPPSVVERALTALPEIAEAVVIGVPDPEWGERVVAYVVPQGEAPLSAADLRDCLSTSLDRAYVPKEFVIVSELPTLPSGKPDRRGLAAAHGQRGRPEPG